MKYIHKRSIFLLIIFIVFSSCKDDITEVEVPFEIEKNEMTVANIGITETFKITAPGRWTASTENAWVKIAPANGEGSVECDIIIESSVLNESRNGTLVISSETGETKIVRITQFGFNKEIILSTSDTIIESSAKLGSRYVDIKVISNVALSHKIVELEEEEGEVPVLAKWIECTNLSAFDPNKTGAKPQEVDLRFEWSNNLEPKERAVEVLFANDELEDTVVLTIRQKAGPIITDDAAGDSLALLIISEKINANKKWSSTEPIRYWDNLVLWQKTDSLVKANPEVLGRVRQLTIKSIITEESIPVEVGNLKYLETLWIGTNANILLKSIDLSKEEDGIGKLENLKHLSIYSYGLVGNLPASWKNLKNLETLDLRGNNFSSIPSMLKKVNFPKLKYLSLSANRRYSNITLYPIMSYPANEMGLYVKTNSAAFRELLKWEELEFIGLSNCILEGKIPTASELRINEVYTEADLAEKGDTLNYLLGKPKVLPNTYVLRLNLNFLNGDIPDWILHHPKLGYWDPWTLLFRQEYGMKNSKGEDVGFNNAPKNWDYYWEMYPLLKPSIE